MCIGEGIVSIPMKVDELKKHRIGEEKSFTVRGKVVRISYGESYPGFPDGWGYISVDVGAPKPKPSSEFEELASEEE